jgi:hypothetical protein
MSPGENRVNPYETPTLLELQPPPGRYVSGDWIRRWITGMIAIGGVALFSGILAATVGGIVGYWWLGTEYGLVAGIYWGANLSPVIFCFIGFVIGCIYLRSRKM